MSYHSESALKSINRRSYFPNACRISGYFDTKFIIIAQIEPILQKSKDTKIDNILNLEQVYFLVTRVIYNHDIHLFLIQVPVYIRVVFLKLGEIDTLKENFAADAFIQARWREPALDGKQDWVREYIFGEDHYCRYWHIWRQVLPFRSILELMNSQIFRNMKSSLTCLQWSYRDLSGCLESYDLSVWDCLYGFCRCIDSYWSKNLFDSLSLVNICMGKDHCRTIFYNPFETLWKSESVSVSTLRDPATCLKMFSMLFRLHPMIFFNIAFGSAVLITKVHQLLYKMFTLSHVLKLVSKFGLV